MPDYRAPGVYVEEVPSAIKPIAGVSTSPAGFIGVFGDEPIMIPGDRVAAETVGTGDGTKKEFDLQKHPVLISPESFAVRVKGELAAGARLDNEVGKAKVTLPEPPDANAPVIVEYVSAMPVTLGEKVVGELVGFSDKEKKEFPLANYPVLTQARSYTVWVGRDATTGALENISAGNVAMLNLDQAPKEQHLPVSVDYVPLKPLAPVGEVRLCTNFSDFTRSFGGFTANDNQRNLAHAVYGFFNNGGSRCYVVRVADTNGIASALAKFAAIDEIAIVAAPGIINTEVRAQIRQHCEVATRDRFAIFDSAKEVDGDLTVQNLKLPPTSTYSAFYFPWLQVFDPVTKAIYPKGDGTMYVPPSGHIAGIYARVDAERGVHKAPANEVVMGALGLRYTVSKAQQGGLNPAGVNCIRSLNGNIQVWGARTLGGDANADLKYINVRRTLLFLRKSIEQGTQWVVFEPNSPELWQRITRNITAFLTIVWRSGALFGMTAAEAFYVKCDAETNPPELRDLGQVVTEIGVAIVRPAEFVIFRISQFSGTGG
jgi:hypothetical protein